MQIREPGKLKFDTVSRICERSRARCFRARIWQSSLRRNGNMGETMFKTMTAMLAATGILAASMASAAPIATPAKPESNIVAVKKDCSTYKKEHNNCKNARWDERAKSCVCKG
jgi:hypothetical protein